MDYFAKDISQLESILDKYQELEFADIDDLRNLDYENHLLGKDVVFAVLLEDDAADIESVVEFAADNKEQITDKLTLYTVDGLTLLLFKSLDYVFIFVRRKDAPEADNLLETIL